MGLGACANLKKDIKQTSPEALPDPNNISADVVGVDMELSFFAAITTVRSVKDLQNVALHLLNTLTSTYGPEVLCLMYETAGVPRNKEIEHRRRDTRYNPKKGPADNSVDGEYFRDVIVQLHQTEDKPPLEVCREVIQELIQTQGLDNQISVEDAMAVMGDSEASDDVAFANSIMMYIAKRMKLTRAAVSEAVTELIGGHLDLFSSTTDASLAAFADIMCPEHMASSSTDEALRRMFEKLMATRKIRRNLRFFMASRIVHADCPAVAKVIRMIGAPYVRYQRPEQAFTFGLIGTDLSQYRPNPSVECLETIWTLAETEQPTHRYTPKLRNGKKVGMKMHDGDLCDRVLVYKEKGSEDVPQMYVNRVPCDVPGEGEAKSVLLMQTYPDKTVLIRSRDSDTLIIMLLGMVDRVVGGKPPGNVYLDMGPVSQVDPTPFVVDIGVLHNRIHSDAAKTVPFKFPVEMFCLQYLLPGCDYFSNPYSLGPGAFAEGFSTLGRLLLHAVERTTQSGLPWILLDEDLLWIFIRIVYAADIGMAARVRERSGGKVQDPSKLAPRTRRGLDVLSIVEQGLEGDRFLEALLSAIPPHTSVVAESEDAARQSLARKRTREGPGAPAMEHDVDLKTFWTEPMIRAYIRRVHWTINYFNSPSVGVVPDALACYNGVSIWGWSIDPTTNHCVTQDKILSTPDLVRMMNKDGIPMDMTAH